MTEFSFWGGTSPLEGRKEGGKESRNELMNEC